MAHRSQSPPPQPHPDLTLWPYQEARRLLERIGAYPPDRPVIFESGFGPSGLPHLGTMCEVLRPSYVQHALKLLDPVRPSRLIVFIDDMDGLRKVPETIPDRERYTRYLGQVVSQIPDPFGACHLSFAEHMLGMLRGFLRGVEVEFELLRSSEMYAGGRFDSALRRILEHHADIIRVIAPTLRPENRAGWSPVMPLCQRCGNINTTLVTAYHPERAAVEFSCEKAAAGARPCGFHGEQTVLGGHCKVQWKADWAMRWYVLGVDYELYGKDLIDSARLSGEILKILGGRPPLGFPFEMFLDERGHKVSKSVGRGVTVEQWRRYAPIEVLKYFLLLDPRRARRLFLDAIPQYVDEYLDALREYPALGDGRSNSRLEFVLQADSPRRFDSALSFGMMMNLVPALGTADRKLIWDYLERYDPGVAANADTRALAQDLVECALNFYADFVEPEKIPFAPTAAERAQFAPLIEFLESSPGASAEEIEKKIYDLGREFYPKPGAIFPLVYRALLGQERGPRLGAFIRLTTPARAAEILRRALAGA